MFQLPLAHLWILLAVVPLSGAALSGLGAACGLLAPRQEIATLLGQLGMSAALLLGVLPADRLPGPVGWLRDLLPSTYGVEALARSFDSHPDWSAVCIDLGVCAGCRCRLARRRDVGVPACGSPVRRPSNRPGTMAQ